MDYAFGKIYKIISNSTDKIYIGSSCTDLRKRLHYHKCAFSNYLAGRRGNITSFELLRNKDVDIILIESYPCKNKMELHARERFWIEEFRTICVNKQHPTRTGKEWRASNVEILKEKRKKYYEENKEKISEMQKVYYDHNKEIITKQHKIYRDAHKTDMAEYKKRYQQVNKIAIAKHKKAYSEQNKEQIAERGKLYRKRNTDAIIAKNKEHILCICGHTFTHSHKARHERTIRHQSFINQQPDQTIQV